MKRIVICIVGLFIFNRAFSQENDSILLYKEIWKSEVINAVFETITDFDTDSTRFVEAFLVFKLNPKSPSGMHTFLLVANEIIDRSLHNPGRLYTTSFFSTTILPKLGSQKDAYFIQPLLFGRTRAIQERVVEPDFYTIHKLPVLDLADIRGEVKTIFYAEQLNYSYTAGR